MVTAEAVLSVDYVASRITAMPAGTPKVSKGVVNGDHRGTPIQSEAVMVHIPLGKDSGRETGIAALISDEPAGILLKMGIYEVMPNGSGKQYGEGLWNVPYRREMGEITEAYPSIDDAIAAVNAKARERYSQTH